MSRISMRPVPKPVRAPKRKPKPLRRSKPLKAKQWGVSRSKRGSAHRNRPREWGYMAFCHDRGCELALDVDTQRILGFAHECPKGDPLEFAHLHDRRRYAPGDIGAVLDRTTHRGIDGKEGGKAIWYVALERRGQHLFRMRLANRARMAWDALLPSQRIDWDIRAAEQRKRPR